MTRKEINRRYLEKLKSDPLRWEKYKKNQKKYSADPRIQEMKRQSARKIWASLPPDHPRRRRRRSNSEESDRKKRRKRHETLPDYHVANAYLHLRVEECSKELIDLKREQIRLNRKLNIRPNTI